MEQPSADEATREALSTRRTRMRDLARTRRRTPASAPDGFLTPAWLDRSFVLPLTAPQDVTGDAAGDGTDVPDQRGRIATEAAAEVETEIETGTAASFVRPPGEEIDFAHVVRRSDLRRTSLRTAWTAAGVAGLAVIAYLVTLAVPVLLVAGLGLLVAATATVVRGRLTHAPVPRLQR